MHSNTIKDILILFLGLMDFEAALKINPVDDDLKMKSENLRKLIEAEENKNDMQWNIIY